MKAIRSTLANLTWAKLLRYCAVSGVATVVSQSVLATLVATRATSAVWANVIAACCGIVPSFELNRRWVWGKQGRRSFGGEMVPFAALTGLGLGLSTLSVGITSHFVEHFSTTARTLSIQAASIGAYGLVWLVQFVVLDHLLFKHRGGAGSVPASASAG